MNKSVYLILSYVDGSFHQSPEKIPHYLCNIESDGTIQGNNNVNKIDKDIINKLSTKNALIFKGDLDIIQFASIMDSMSSLYDYSFSDILESKEIKCEGYNIIHLKYQTFNTKETYDTPDRWD